MMLGRQTTQATILTMLMMAVVVVGALSHRYAGGAPVGWRLEVRFTGRQRHWKLFAGGKQGNTETGALGGFPGWA